MNIGYHDRELAFNRLVEFIDAVKERTLLDYAPSNEVFRGLFKKIHVSNDNSVGVFISSNLLKIDNTRGNKVIKYIKWCGPDHSTTEIAKAFVIVRDNMPKKVKSPKDETIEAAPAGTSTINDVSKEEYKEKYYGGTRGKDSMSDLLKILSEVAIHLGSPKTKQEIFKMYVEINGTYKCMDVRDMFKRRKTIFSAQLLLKLGYIRQIDNVYIWATTAPTMEMVENMHLEYSYEIFLTKERKIVKVEAPVVAKTNEGVEEIKPNFPGTFIYDNNAVKIKNKENPEGIDVKDMNNSDKLNFLVAQQIRNIEFQTEISKNLITLTTLFEKAVRNGE